MSPEVAIIGAGLSGLALALALHQQSISCTVYESRSDAPLNIGGAIMLSPNALRILDRLGVFARIRDRGYTFSKLEYRDSSNSPPTLTDVQEFGDVQKYGYDGLRIYRTELIDTLLTMLQEVGIKIQYGKKFTCVVEESNDKVVWQSADGETNKAKLLIGADGIHSTVRKYLYPELVPQFVGVAGVAVPVPTSQLKASADVHLPVTYTHPTAGGFLIAPQKPDASEVFIGKQRRIAGQPSRAEWDAIAADKASLIKFLQEGNDNFPEIVRNAVSDIMPDRITVWPFHMVPRLDRWTSDKHRRVIILGDAAHAIPPSAGQGINQAFEDIYMISRLYAAATKGKSARATDRNREEMTADALAFWQEYRQARVDEVLKLNKQIDLRRMPQERGQEIERLDLELEWLYNADFDAVIEDWLDGRMAKESAKRICPVERLFGWRK